MNAHVVLYYRFLNWWAEKRGEFMAQLVWYTALMVELDPNWNALNEEVNDGCA